MRNAAFVTFVAQEAGGEQQLLDVTPLFDRRDFFRVFPTFTLAKRAAFLSVSPRSGREPELEHAFGSRVILIVILLHVIPAVSWHCSMIQGACANWVANTIP